MNFIFFYENWSSSKICKSNAISGPQGSFARREEQALLGGILAICCDTSKCPVGKHANARNRNMSNPRVIVFSHTDACMNMWSWHCCYLPRDVCANLGVTLGRALGCWWHYSLQIVHYICRLLHSSYHNLAATAGFQCYICDDISDWGSELGGRLDLGRQVFQWTLRSWAEWYDEQAPR